jgi:small GTP-binding protein
MKLTATRWDTAGQEDYDRIRPLSYANADIFLLCFSIINPASFDNVTDKWFPEIKHFCPHARIALVGTKLDLRTHTQVVAQLATNGAAPITTDQGKAKAKQIRADMYIECSAYTREKLVNVFTEAVSLVASSRINKSRQKKSKCTIL